MDTTRETLVWHPLKEPIIQPRVRGSVVLALAVLYPPAMAWIYFVVIGEDSNTSESPMAFVFSAGKFAQFLIPAIYVFTLDRAAITWRLPSLRGLLEGAAFAGLVALAMFALYFGVLRDHPLIVQTPERIFHKLQQFGCDTPMRFVILAGLISIVHSALEEYYWRWFLDRMMNRFFPIFWSILLTNLSFMLHHIVVLGVYLPGQFWTLAMPFSFAVAVGGIVWSWLYHRSGSLWGAWLSHALIDGAIMVIGYDLVRNHF